MATDDEIDSAYLAGIIDGEGCIGCYRYGKRFMFALTVSMSEPEAVKMLGLRYGGHYSFRQSKRANVRPQHIIRIASAEELRNCLLELEPYLHIKRKQAQLALEFLETYCEYYYKDNPIPKHIKIARDRIIEEIKAEKAPKQNQVGLA